MKTLDLDLDLTLREDPQDGYLATLYGRAVPYDTPTRIGSIEESFDREAFDPAEVIGKPLAWRHGEPIGVITAAANKDDGLYITAGIVDTVQGRDANALLRAKAVTGLSVGFTPVKSAWNKTRTSVRHTVARLAETSLTHMPAYATAGVSAIREEEPMEETTTVETPVVSPDIEAREAIAELRSRLEAVVNTSEPVHPLAQYRSLGEYVKAIYTGTEERTLNVQALSEQTGLIPPTWLTDVKGVLDRGRPCISALGGPLPAGSSSMDIKWPTFAGDLSAIVAAQSSEGDEVNSADVDITVGSATLATYAGGSRLTYQVIDRADPSYLTNYMRILVGAYGTETDYAFQAALWSASTHVAGMDYDFSADTTGSAFLANVWQAMIAVETATGQPAEVIYVSSAVFAKIGDPAWTSFQSQNYPVQNVGGTFNGRTLGVNVFGVPVVMARAFATDESQDVIVTNRAAIGWAEDGPRFVNSEQAGNLGRDVAIYGYGVATPFIPSGVLSIYNHA